MRLEPVLCDKRGTSVRSPAPQKELGRPVHLELVLCNERRHFSEELCTTGKSSPCLPQPGKVRVQQRRPSAGKNKYLKYPQKKKKRKKSENISTELLVSFVGNGSNPGDHEHLHRLFLCRYYCRKCCKIPEKYMARKY